MHSISFGDDKLPGYEVGSQTGPAIIVLQEWWGVTEAVKQQAVMLSEATGFRTLIPDLYKGKLGVDAEEAGHLMGNLDWMNAIREMSQAVAYLRASGASKVGVHCGVDAAVPFYGTPQAQLCQVEKIAVPVQAHFGRKDTHTGFSDVATAQAVTDSMKAAGCNVELCIYEEGGHGFFNSLVPGGTSLLTATSQPMALDDAKLALSRTVEFFKKHLSA
ncbi:MAG: hypothetical protein WDW36_009473 [Sanguina aurantia]